MQWFTANTQTSAFVVHFRATANTDNRLMFVCGTPVFTSTTNTTPR
ncbi:hypothetical protein ACFOOM_09975 [Streptomyces echinoruber]